MKWLARLLAPKQPYRLEVFPSKRHTWMWRLRHENGQVLATSEEYSSHEKAWHTAEAIAGWTGWPLDEGV